MDLSKAFDCIPYSLLIAKLDAYGFSFETSISRNSYLRDCKQCTKIKNICSDFLNILSGAQYYFQYYLIYSLTIYSYP